MHNPRPRSLKGRPKCAGGVSLIFNSPPSPSCGPGPRPEEPPWSKMAVRIQHLQPGRGPCQRDQGQNVTVPKGIAADDPIVFFFFNLLNLVWKLKEGTEGTCEPQHQYCSPQECSQQPGMNISSPSFSEILLERSHCPRALSCSVSR